MIYPLPIGYTSRSLKSYWCKHDT